MRRCTIALLALALLPACAQDDAVTAPDLRPQLINLARHTYKYVYLGPVSWAQANSLAIAAVDDQFEDWHLATITTEAENAAVLAAMSGASDNCWIGLYQDTESRKYLEPDAGWRWVTKDHYGYRNWSNGEPNNSGLAEHWAEMTASGTWNDMPDGTHNNCSVMERE